MTALSPASQRLLRTLALVRRSEIAEIDEELRRLGGRRTDLLRARSRKERELADAEAALLAGDEHNVEESD